MNLRTGVVVADFEQDRALLIRLWRMWGSRVAELSDEQCLNADPVEAEPRHERMAETVRRLAADVERSTIATRFDSEFPAAFERITGLSRASVIAHPFLESVALGAFLDMAILETTIHWLDVIDAVGGPRPEAMALERTRDVLAAVPDPLTFVEAASGRSDPAILPVIH